MHARVPSIISVPRRRPRSAALPGAQAPTPQVTFAHTKLTYRYNGRDMRLTDVYGTLIPQIIG